MARAGLESYCDRYEFAGNLIIGSGDAKNWPEGNRMASSMDDVGFENHAAGNYRVKRESPFFSTEGPGADMDALLKATAGAISGEWP
jgi:hypothetical protein